MTAITTQPDCHQATWQFPSNDEGAEYGFVDAAAAHFRAAPMDHLVREMIQNAMDAKVDGLDEPVRVSFTETKISTHVIGGNSLRPHLASCLTSAKEKGQTEAATTYANALEALDQPTINCLCVVDSGTTGLVDANWKALVIQEGVVHKNRPASGGSNGIGKNAVFNVSDLQTVMYSTRYLARRKGREEKLQGKSRLATHTEPTGGDEQLQHIGFYRTEARQPLRGREIPDVFRLADTGTGVFIPGFNAHCTNWARSAMAAVLENFFFAIHNQQLVVEIRGNTDQPAIALNHETIDHHFATTGKSENYAYYRAIRDCSAHAVEVGVPLGPLQVHILKGQGPRRTACLNRNGMLITDSRERKRNCLAPQNRNFWPDYAAVVVAATPQGDEWLRTMENPGHDAITPHQIRGTSDRRQAESILNQARNALREVYDYAFNTTRYHATSNLTELAYALPELSLDAPKDIPLQTTMIGTKPQSTQHRTPAEALSGDQAPILLNQRIISTGGNEAMIAFNVNQAGAVNLKLHPTGAERSSETHIDITSIQDMDHPGMPVDLSGGVATINVENNRRVRLKITAAQDIANLAFTLQ